MTRIPRSWWTNALFAALTAVGAWWLVTNTEWVAVPQPAPLKGEAAENPHYVAERLLRELGNQVVERKNLDQLPPPGTVLLLHSYHWALFPERVQRLQTWVEHGGHLVIPPWLLNSNEAFAEWLPVQWARPPKPSAASAASAPDTPRAPRPRPLQSARLHLPCHVSREPAEQPGAFGGPRSYELCGAVASRFELRGHRVPLWSTGSDLGRDAVRIGVGQGSVSVVPDVWDNAQFLEGDNALVIVAAAGAPRGQTVWFVVDETRPNVLLWLWQQGAPAIALAGVALALALWRAAVRFGPPQRPPPLGRRSVGEQVRGTGEFLLYREPQALHRAALRALDEAARRHVRRYARLERGRRAEAIAALAAVPADELAMAMDTHIARPRGAWPPVLALLETARRRLQDIRS